MAKRKKKRINTSTIDGRGRPPKDPTENKPHKYKKHRVSSKEDWTQEQLDKYYSRRGVAETIRNTPVTGTKKLTDSEVNDIYEKYNITKFANKTEFRKYYKEHGLVDPKYDLEERENLLNKMWEDYKHRDALIRTGQYDTIRNGVYKENYLKALEAIGAPEVVIESLRKASDEAWEKMASAPNTDKNSMRDTLLPHLGEFAYSTKGDVADFDEDYISNLILDITKAMSSAGIDIQLPQEEEEEYEVTISDYLRNGYVINEFDELEYGEDFRRRKRKERRENTLRTYRGAIKFLPKETRVSMESLVDAEDIQETIADQFPILTRKGRKRFRIGRSGSIYAPFVGSQASNSTRDVINTIINELDKKGVPRSSYIEGWEDL